MILSVGEKLAFQSVSVILSLLMIVYFLLKGKKTPLIYSYIWCQSLIFIWSIGQAFELVAPDVDVKWFYIRFEHTAICFIGLSWLIFSLLYTEHKLILRSRIIMAVLFIIPMVNYIIVFTNGYHHLMYTELTLGSRVYGPYFWVNITTVYSNLLAGTVLLVTYSVKQFGYAKKQSILLIIAVLIPIISNLTYVFGILRPGVDLTPISFSFSLTAFAIAAFRYRFLNIIPIALRKIVENMSESIMVVDNLNKIVNYNQSFKENIPGCAGIKDNDDISVFISSIIENIEHTQEGFEVLKIIQTETKKQFNGELCFEKPVRKCFTINMQPISYKKNEAFGRVISFNDVSEYKNLLWELNKKNNELLSMNQELGNMNEVLSALNEQLKEFAATAEELAVTKERNRFARDVHDTLGHTMTLLIALLEVCFVTCKTDPVKTEEKLTEASRAARDGLKELRRSISGLIPGKLEADNLINALKSLTADFQPSGMNIEFSVTGMDTYKNPAYSDVVYRLCQEALTNSLRHGEAKNVIIILRFIDGMIKLFIFDDGIGCKKVMKGFGLSGMEQRVSNLNGRITYGSDGEKGFNIRVEIPLGRVKI